MPPRVFTATRRDAHLARTCLFEYIFFLFSLLVLCLHAFSVCHNAWPLSARVRVPRPRARADASAAGY